MDKHVSDRVNLKVRLETALDTDGQYVAVAICDVPQGPTCSVQTNGETRKEAIARSLAALAVRVGGHAAIESQLRELGHVLVPAPSVTSPRHSSVGEIPTELGGPIDQAIADKCIAAIRGEQKEDLLPVHVLEEQPDGTVIDFGTFEFERELDGRIICATAGATTAGSVIVYGATKDLAIARAKEVILTERAEIKRLAAIEQVKADAAEAIYTEQVLAPQAEVDPVTGAEPAAS